MYTLICTTYNVQKDNKLQLRNNWTEDLYYDGEVVKRLQDYQIDLVEKFPRKAGDISEILEGTFSLPDTVIHLRILKQ